MALEKEKLKPYGKSWAEIHPSNSSAYESLLAYDIILGLIDFTRIIIRLLFS
jgi:hypothetical protein